MSLWTSKDSSDIDGKVEHNDAIMETQAHKVVFIMKHKNS